jgi:replicative superfamily II helicase
MHVRDLQKLGIPQSLIEAWEKRGVADLTEIQAASLSDDRFRSTRNLLVVAPTSSGKTFVGEVAAVLTALGMRRVIYLVPMKAIAEEKFRDFRQTYGEPQIGLDVVISSGDHSEYDPDILAGNFNLAVVVNEKFAQLLVQRSDLLAMCGLVVVDELQLIRDERRGPGLEMLLTKIIMSPRGPRIVGLSATLRALNGLDTWLGAKVIESRSRPVPLHEGVCDLAGAATYYDEDGTTFSEQFPIAGPCAGNDELLVKLAQVLVAQKQTLVFVATKESTHAVAASVAGALPTNTVPREVADDMEVLDDTEFKAFMQREGIAHRVGYHNADLDPEERLLVERLFREGHLRVLVSTTTLAMGVNLPTDLVVIRDVERWDPAQRARVALPNAEYKNAAGRAGRLGTRTEGRSLLLATSPFQAEQMVRGFIRGELEGMDSAIPKERDIAFHVLSLFASRLVASEAQAIDVFSASYAYHVFYHEYSDQLESAIRDALARCMDLSLVEKHDDELKTTKIGLAVASYGISIGTFELIRASIQSVVELGFSVPDILFGLVRAQEIAGLAPYLRVDERDRDNFRPMLAARTDTRSDSLLSALLSRSEPPTQDENTRLKKVALLVAWVEGTRIRDLESAFRIGLGAIRRLAETASWLVEAASHLCPFFGGSGETAAAMHSLSDELNYGVPYGLIPIARLRPRGVGRDVLIRLLHNDRGLVVSNPDALFDIPDEAFEGVMGPRQLDALRNAALAYVHDRQMLHMRGHSLRLARAAPMKALVEIAYRAPGRGFEVAIRDLLTAPPLSLDCTLVPRQRYGEEDLHLNHADGVIVIQATASEEPSRNVRWDKAREVLGQGVGLSPVSYVVIVKPDFHETAIRNAREMSKEAGRRLLLVPFSTLSELCVRVVEGSLPKEILASILRHRAGYISYEDLQGLVDELGASPGVTE